MEPKRSATPRLSIAALLADERVRFLIIGGFNTVIGYALFAALQITVGHVIGYLGSLYVSYLLGVALAFVMHRRFTFQKHGTGNVVVDFLRFASVYVVSLAINTVVLPLLVEVAGLDPLIAQAITVVITTLVSYFGHKYFSFRRAKSADPR
jgi:putative flippase GtrA